MLTPGCLVPIHWQTPDCQQQMSLVYNLGKNHASYGPGTLYGQLPYTLQFLNLPLCFSICAIFPPNADIVCYREDWASLVKLPLRLCVLPLVPSLSFVDFHSQHVIPLSVFYL